MNIFTLFFFFCIEISVSREDLDQMWQSVASNLGLHCLHMTPKTGFHLKRDDYDIQLTLVISKSKGPSDTLRHIRFQN